MKTLLALAFVCALTSVASAQSPDGSFCTGETIDTFAVGYPVPELYRTQTGIFAVGVHNTLDASIGLTGNCFTTDITAKLYMPGPDGNPDMTAPPLVLFSGVTLLPGEEKTAFVPVDGSVFNSTTDYVNANVVVDGLAQGVFPLHSERNVYVHLDYDATAAPLLQQEVRHQRRRHARRQ